MTSADHSFPAAAPPAPGVFIVFEGNDGTGKSTQARMLAEHLQQGGLEVVLTREPGGTPIGEKLRSLVLEHGQGTVDPRTEALVYAASRAAHAHQLIRPALERGAVVVCDRYIDSSAAYQGAGRGLGIQEVTSLSQWATEGLEPDATVYLELDGADARTRVRDRGAADRLESEPETFHETVRTAFAELARRQGPGRHLVDGRGTPQAVAERVLQALAPVLPLPAGDPA